MKGAKTTGAMKLIKEYTSKKKLTKRLKAKSILKKSQATVRISDYKAPSILGDPNRFFKEEMEETKKSLFFE